MAVEEPKPPTETRWGCLSCVAIAIGLCWLTRFLHSIFAPQILQEDAKIFGEATYVIVYITILPWASMLAFETLNVLYISKQSHGEEQGSLGSRAIFTATMLLGSLVYLSYKVSIYILEDEKSLNETLAIVGPWFLPLILWSSWLFYRAVKVSKRAERKSN